MTALAEPPDPGLAPGGVAIAAGCTWMYLGARSGRGPGFPYAWQLIDGTPRDAEWRRRFRGWLVDALRIAAESYSDYTARHFAPLIAVALPHLEAGEREAHIREAARLIEAARCVDAGYDDPERYGDPGCSRTSVVNALNAQADDELARAVDSGHPLLLTPDAVA